MKGPVTLADIERGKRQLIEIYQNTSDQRLRAACDLLYRSLERDEKALFGMGGIEEQLQRAG